MAKTKTKQPSVGEVIMGRPKITTDDFPTNWREMVLAEFKVGASREEIYAMLDISDSTFARLMREDVDFSRTIKAGERYSKAWWLMAGRTQLRNREFSYVGWYMNMKNRFDWTDKQETKGTLEVIQPILGGSTADSAPADDTPLGLPAGD